MLLILESILNLPQLLKTHGDGWKFQKSITSPDCLCVCVCSVRTKTIKIKAIFMVLRYKVKTADVDDIESVVVNNKQTMKSTERVRWRAQEASSEWYQNDHLLNNI